MAADAVPPEEEEVRAVPVLDAVQAVPADTEEVPWAEAPDPRWVVITGHQCITAAGDTGLPEEVLAAAALCASWHWLLWLQL